LQIPITGHPLHTRSLTVVVTTRPDGRWGARGDVVDLRKCGFVPMTQGIQPAGVIHLMTLDVELDPASRRLEAIASDQPVVAIEPSEETGGECCRDPAHRLQALVGEPLDAGFAKRLAGVFGGPRGCSHLLTLFQLMASALPRALDLEEALAEPRDAGDRFFRRSAFVEGFEAEDGSIEYAIQLHDFQGRPGPMQRPVERLGRHDEVRVFARVETPSLAVRELRASRRTRTPATLATAGFEELEDGLGGLVGEPIVPGMARRVFAALGDGPAEALVRDALLQLAPAHIQVMAAVADRWFAMAPSGARPRSKKGPEVAALGGFPDSCYMWRGDGVLQRSRMQALGEEPGS
jgi:hypothetical protein